jgi:hypothetical protein
MEFAPAASDADIRSEKGEKSVDSIVLSAAAPFGLEVVGIVTLVALSLGYIGRRG